jgi:hypothetical protein
MTRWLKVLIIVMVIGMLAGIVLALTLPKSSGEESQTEVVQEETSGDVSQTPGDTSSQDSNAGQSGQSEDGGGSVSINPGQGSNGDPGLTVTFPDPASGGEQPPAGEYKDVYGQWIADMSGTTYGLKNCYLSLESSGNIIVPDIYDSVFEISGSQFQWQSGSPGVSVQLQAILKLGNQTQIPLKLEMTGQVSDSFDKIEGTFSAVPLVDIYSVYAQQGNFTMHR